MDAQDVIATQLALFFVLLIGFVGWQCNNSWRTSAQAEVVRAEEDCLRTISRTNPEFGQCVHDNMKEWVKKYRANGK